jgi:hypothetical protein
VVEQVQKIWKSLEDQVAAVLSVKDETREDPFSQFMMEIDDKNEEIKTVKSY